MKPSGVTVRMVALDALLRVEQDAAFLDRVLPGAMDRANLSNEDRGLCMEIATGVLRRRRWLDKCLAPHVKGGLARLDPIVLQILRVGAYQLVVLDRIPPHAAVSTTVELAKRRRRFAAGLVNAVLRKLTSRPAVPTDRKGLAEYASVPDWIADALAQTVGAPLETILTTFAEAPHTTLRVLENRLTRDQLLEQLSRLGANAHACTQSSSGVVLDRAGDPSSLAGFGSNFIAQDEAAQLVCDLARGEKTPTLDGCAAPGGKSLALWSMGHTELTSVDVHEGRVRLLKGSFEKANVPANAVQADMTKPPFEPGSFATVMLDAPCSGSGTLRRHPELRWTLQESALTELVPLQAAILSAGAALVRPGGCLIYAVCSFLPQEGAEQVRAFLAQHPQFKLEATVDTAPLMHVMDGFYAAKLRLLLA